MRLGLRVCGLTDPEDLAVDLNEHTVSNGSLADGWVTCAVSPTWLRCGANAIRITRARESERSAHLEDVHVRIAQEEDGHAER